MNIINKRRHFLSILYLGVFITMLSGCSGTQVAPTEEVIVIEQEIVETLPPDETIMALTPNGALLPQVDGVEAEFTEPIPDFLRVGMSHPIVQQLQERLMELGFMDFDEPTDYYGEVTAYAVSIYQRQNKLAQDGIVGPQTLDAILDPDAKHYAAQHGDKGDDIARIQSRLFELGYILSDDLITGTFGDTTLGAVEKLQELNEIQIDGKVGHETMDLLYSGDVKPNLLAFGEESEIVLDAQEQLKALGYMTSEPDGKFGSDTIIAVKQFQSRNDQIVDGYLGPSTRIALYSDDALPNGIALGDSGDSVYEIQDLLQDLGYLSASHATGYFGEITHNAVELFQRTNYLSVDGQVGVQTMTELTSGEARRAPSGSSTAVASSGGSSNSSSSSSSSSQSSNQGSDTSNNTGASTIDTGSYGSGSVDALISVASSKLGSSYVWGAKGPNTFDCSGFIYWCLKQVGVNQSYLTSSGWRSVGKYTKISNFSDLKAGDIIVMPGHVGIVAYNGMVIDASSSNGKVVHRSLSSWWQSKFIVGWRIF